MSEENNTSENAEQQDDCDIWVLQDVIKNEKENKDIVAAVLGASDATNCSYSKGYIYRQALYGCATCHKDTKDLHGICLACTYSCHQNHDLYELYTKRNFRCDCGNKKFPASNPCKLQQNKDDLNELNKYNHNFEGLYCVCNRPYPDPEKEEEDDDEPMSQCSICEDWFHSSHLAGHEKFKNLNEDYDEMICHLCMKENSYLWYYQGYIACSNVESSKITSEQDSVDILNKSDQEQTSLTLCFLDKLKLQFHDLELPTEQVCYFLNDWRDALCRCKNCLDLYKAHNVEYLILNEDTIKFYEDKGKLQAQNETIDENKFIDDQLSKLNHVSKIEFMHNVNDFKEELKDFLSNFATEGKIVKRENVVEFFDELNNRKRQRLDKNLGDVASNYYCK